MMLAMVIAAAAAVASPAPTALPAVRHVATHHTVRLASGALLAYTATAGTLLLRNDKGEPTASIFSVAYTTGDKTRPVTFVYNGGPGSASLWLHLGAFGPRRIVTTNATFIPPPPYQLEDNPQTLLDTTDLVFIDPVGTGYSVSGGAGTDKDFWGIDEDLREFSQFIRRWVAENGRANSEKFLLGESYGTFRSAGLADRLQQDGTAVNGVILISSLLNYGDAFGAPGDANVSDALALPSEAAVAWYHHAVPNPAPDVPTAVERARAFVHAEYLPMLFASTPLTAEERAHMAARMHELIGLDPAYLLRANLRVTPERFEAELLRDRGEIVGRYDGRYAATSIDHNAGEPDFDPSYEAVSPAFNAMITAYVSSELGWSDDRLYRGLTGEPGNAWNFVRKGYEALASTVVPDLREAMHTNPNLHVFAACGWYDLATPLGIIEYELANVGLDPGGRARTSFGYYPSGHMIYLNAAALRSLRSDLRGFYAATLHG